MLEIKELPNSEIEIAGEMPAEEFSKYWPKAVGELSKGVSMAGFRPGKVPEKVLIEKVGEAAVLEKAAELALQQEYFKIIKEKKLEVIGSPKATITKIAKNAPLGYKFQTAVLPKLKLPENFKQIAGDIFTKKEEIKVEDKEIEDAIEYVRKLRADKETKELPEVNDEFAKSVGKFKTLAEMRENIRESITKEKKYKAEEKKNIEAMDEIIKKSKVDVPQILIEGEKNKMLAEMKTNVTSMGLKWEDYLKHVKKMDLSADLSAKASASAEALAKAEKEILEGWTDDAAKRVKYGLLLRQLEDELKIEVSDAEIDEEIKKIPNANTVDSNRLKDYVYGILRNKKIFNFLKEN